MNTKRILGILTIIALAAATGGITDACAEDEEPAAEASKAVLDTDIARFSYAVGLQLGGSLKQGDMEWDVDALFAAIDDSLKGRTPAMTEEEMIAAMTALQKKMMEAMESQGEKNLEVGQKFLEDNAGKEGVIETESGLQYKVLEKGTGDKPAQTSKVRVHYRGSLLDGSEFDSSYSRGEPATFQVNQVIAGWQEALQLMPVGSKYQLFIPSGLAYGEHGNQRIPGNSVLLFDVELLDILD